MATHYIPKNLKGETRILVIFSTKSLITTAICAGIGGVIFLVCRLLSMKTLGMILLIIFALMGFVIGTVKIPKITGLKFTKNIEGDSIDETILKFIKFKTNKKIYTYTKEEE